MAKNSHGKAVQHSILGRIKSKLKIQDNCFVVDKWQPTTKYCFDCGEKHTLLSLNEREFVCPNCGVVYDRDVHAALNILLFGLKLVPQELRKFMPLDSDLTTNVSDKGKDWEMKMEATPFLNVW